MRCENENDDADRRRTAHPRRRRPQHQDRQQEPSRRAAVRREHRAGDERKDGAEEERHHEQQHQHPALGIRRPQGFASVARSGRTAKCPQQDGDDDARQSATQIGADAAQHLAERRADMLRHDGGERGEVVLVEPVEMRHEDENCRRRGDPGRARAQISAALRVDQHRRREPGEQEYRLIAPVERDAGGDPCEHRPADVPRLERAQERERRDRPRPQQRAIGIEALAVDAIERRQYQEQQHENALVAGDLAARDEVDREQGEARIHRREQIERPVDRRQQEEPDRSDQWCERRRAEIARCRMERADIGVDEFRRRPDRGVGDECEARQRRDEQENEDASRSAARRIVEPGAEHRADRPVFRLQIGEHIHGSDRARFGRSSITPAGVRASGRRTGRTGNGCRAAPGRPRGDTGPRTPAGP